MPSGRIPVEVLEGTDAWHRNYASAAFEHIYSAAEWGGGGR